MSGTFGRSYKSDVFQAIRKSLAVGFEAMRETRMYGEACA
jgi:hypothetical protein